MLVYPMSTGRNFNEVLRVLDSMQLTAKHKVATPVNWKNGEDVIILPSVPEEEARQKFPMDGRRPSRICASSRNRNSHSGTRNFTQLQRNCGVYQTWTFEALSL